jgi:hypothetical protein
MCTGIFFVGTFLIFKRCQLIKNFKHSSSQTKHICRLEMLQEGSDREKGHQSFWEARLLSKLAATQLPRTKGAFLVYHLEQVTEMGIQLVPYMVTYYFIGYFNLWGEMTLLRSHPR